jgi:hypothetical protein
MSAVACKETIDAVIGSFMEITGDVKWALDPHSEDDDLCDACQAEAKAAHDVGRNDLIDDLPSFFGLRPWDELKDF